MGFLINLAINKDDAKFLDLLTNYLNVNTITNYRNALHFAAEQGNGIAQYNLGLMYKDGIGVAKDAKEAVRFFQLAANQGHAHDLDLLRRLLKK